MANSGQTVVTVKKLNNKFTRVNNYQLYILQYEAGEARPHISLDTVNSQFLKAAGLVEDQTYVMFWKEIGTTPSPNGGDTPKFRMDFKLVDTSNAIDWIIQLKKLEGVYGNQSGEEQLRREKFRRSAMVTSQSTVNENSESDGFWNEEEE